MSTFTIEPGEIVGFLGLQRRSAKTPHYRCFYRLIHTSAGEVEVAGCVSLSARQGPGLPVQINLGVWAMKQQLIWILPPLDSCGSMHPLYGIDDERSQTPHRRGLAGMCSICGEEASPGPVRSAFARASGMKARSFWRLLLHTSGRSLFSR